MHAHQSHDILHGITGAALWPMLTVVIGMMLFLVGLPIPVGYERGKIKWVAWCGTGMHAHVVYWHGGESGFQSIHPKDYNAG